MVGISEAMMIGFLGNVPFLSHPLKDFLDVIPGTYYNTKSCQLSSINVTSGKMGGQTKHHHHFLRFCWGPSYATTLVVPYVA